MKKPLTRFLTLVVIVLMATLAACAAPTPTPVPPTKAPAAAAPTIAPAAPPAAGQKATIAVCLPALDNPLMLALRDAFANTFKAKYNVEVASADGNPNTQAAQVENYTAMKVKFMFVMAVEARRQPRLLTRGQDRAEAHGRDVPGRADRHAERADD